MAMQRVSIVPGLSCVVPGCYCGRELDFGGKKIEAICHGSVAKIVYVVI